MSDNELVVQSTPEKLLELAISKDIDIEKLERLMAMVKQHNEAEASKSFKMAMVGFQAKKPILPTTSVVSFNSTSYKFAPLSKIQQAVDPILSEFGLSYNWKQEQTEGKVKIICIVSHIDGHSEETSLEAPNDTSGGKNAIHSIGSSVSYLKRYTMTAALGLSSDDDTDGKTKDDPLEMDKKTLEPGCSIWDVKVADLKNGNITLDKLKSEFRISAKNVSIITKVSLVYNILIITLCLVLFSLILQSFHPFHRTFH